MALQIPMQLEEMTQILGGHGIEELKLRGISQTELREICQRNKFSDNYRAGAEGIPTAKLYIKSEADFSGYLATVLYYQGSSHNVMDRFVIIAQDKEANGYIVGSICQRGEDSAYCH